MSGSDTEPESDSDIHNSLFDSSQRSDAEFGSPITYAGVASGKTLTAVPDAIQMLAEMDVRSVHTDFPAHESRLEDVANALLISLDRMFTIIANPCTPDDTRSFVTDLRQLLAPPTLHLLFEYRIAFQKIAASKTNVHRASAVVSWVDVVLVKLANLITNLIFHRNGQTVTFSGLDQRRNDGMFRAATQLPREWASVPFCLSSESASPAACRIALALSYGAFVLGPRLGNSYELYDQMSRAEVEQVLLHYAPKLSELQASYHPLGFNKAHTAMLIALLANVSVQGEENSAPFQPTKLSAVLTLLADVFAVDGAASDVDLLSPAKDLQLEQAALIFHELVVPWLWRQWNDGRLLGASCIVHITSTWLYHCDSEEAEPAPPDFATIAKALALDPSSAVHALIHLLRRAVSVFGAQDKSESSDDLKSIHKVLYRACRMGARIFESLETQSSIGKSQETELANLLCSLLALVPDRLVRNQIIDALGFVAPATVSVAIDSALSDDRFSFRLRLDQVLSHIHNSCFKVPRGETEADLDDCSHILNLVTILWNGRCRRCFNRRTISTFLASVMDLLTAERSCELLGRLGTPMLNALTMLEDMRRSDSMDDGGEVNVLWDDEAIWLLVIRHQEENLMLACGLANYVIATARLKTCTALTAIEAWDYLRDILLLVLTQHFFCEDMALALLICPSVCIALSELLRWTAPSAVRYLLSSPWTMTLCLRLERISETNAEDDFFHRCVKSRLQDCGGRLLRWVQALLKEQPLPPDSHNSASERSRWRMIVCHPEPGSRLLLVRGD